MSPWEAVEAAFTKWLDALLQDPDQHDAETKRLAREYRELRTKANAVAPKAAPSRVSAAPPAKRT